MTGKEKWETCRGVQVHSRVLECDDKWKSECELLVILYTHECCFCQKRLECTCSLIKPFISYKLKLVGIIMLAYTCWLSRTNRVRATEKKKSLLHVCLQSGLGGWISPYKNLRMEVLYAVWSVILGKIDKSKTGRGGQDDEKENNKESMCARSCTQLLSEALRLPFVHSLFQREGQGAERDSLQQMAELCSAEVRNSPLAWPKITACLLFSAQPWVHLTRLGLCLAWSSPCNQTVALLTGKKKRKQLLVCFGRPYLHCVHIYSVKRDPREMIGISMKDWEGN